MSAVVTLKSVRKEFGDRVAVAGVDLEVPQGSCFGLLGPNGAGKTTTLRMIYGVTRPTAGEVSVFGTDVVKDPRSVRRRLGVTLQENSLIEPLTPVENLRIFGGYHLMDAAEIEARIEELLDFLDLRSHHDVPVRALSGGFQRRLSIAMSLMNRPELLVLDEPTTGLDPAVRQLLWERIRTLRRQGTTVLVTTHYMDEAERLCDHVCVFHLGRIVAQGSPVELIERLAPDAVELECPASEEARILDGVARHHLRAGSRLIVYTDDPAAVMARARTGATADCGRIITRPTNLEDVFLALTGARIEEAPE